MKTKYIDPDGQETHDPGLDLFRRVLESGGAAYWLSGSATASILFLEPGPHQSAQMDLVVAPDEGVVVRYCSPAGDDEFVLLNLEGAQDDFVMTYPGGDEWPVPRAFLSTQEQALLAIAQFLDSGAQVAGHWHILGTL